MMELNENILTVLKNFSTINQNILIDEGNEIKTISEAKNVLAKAIVNQQFPKRFGVYDLNEFINVLSLVDTPNLEFQDNYINIQDSTGRSKIKYFFSAEETITTLQKDIKMPEADIEFVLDKDTLNRIKRASTTLGHNILSIQSEREGILSLSVLDKENATSNKFTIDVGGDFDEKLTFNYMIDINNLKLISSDYKVKISSKLISEFTSTELPVTYWIALEKSSVPGV